MLTDEEIKKVRHGLVTVSLSNVDQMIKSGGIKPTFLDNGYMVSFSLDVMRENLRILHLSVSNMKGDTNIEMAKSITRDIIGEGYQMIGSMNVKTLFIL